MLLDELTGESAEVSIVELAHRLAMADIGPADCLDAYLELYHIHAPVLEGAGLVEWDRGSGEVWLTATGEEAGAMLKEPTGR